MARGISNTNKLQINNNFFQGGNSVSKKLGIPNSFYQSVALDNRSDPAQMSVLPAPQQLSGTMSDLVLAMEQDLNGVRWGVGSKGNVYKFDTSDNISVEGVMSENGSAGILYNNITDQLYIPGQTKVSMYGQVTTGLTGQPSFRKDTFAQSSSTNNGCAQIYDPTTANFDGAFRNTASVNYTVPTSLSETPGTFCVFSPDIEPGYSIQAYITAPGTGDWTLTLHDSQNNKLTSKTILNANVVTGFNEFVFGSQIRVLVGGGIASGAANYHFHLTSTVSDGTVQVVPVNSNPALGTGDLMSVNMLWSAYRLVQTNNGWHPTAMFGVRTGTGNGQALCIGNGNYLSTYNFGNDSSPSNLQWIRHQLVFEYGEEVCGLATNNQYLVIATERRSKNSARMFQKGTLYFWDGTTPQASFKIPITMGAPYGLHTENNVTYFACAGSLYAWSGGQTVIKVRKLAYQNTDYLNETDTTLVNPNMFTSRYGILLLGYPSSTTNPNITYGNWSWGTVELTFPNSYVFSYALSNGYTTNSSPISNLQIGCNVNYVDTLYTSWSYTDANSVTHYGIDRLNNSSSAATSGTWMSLMFDGGSRFKYKQAERVKVSFTSLPSGCTVTPFYILDRGAKVSGVPTVGDGTAFNTDALVEINTRCHEIQFGFDFTCPTGLMTPPIFTGITLEIDGNEVEIELAPDK